MSSQDTDFHAVMQEQRDRAWQQLTSFDTVRPGTLRQMQTAHVTALVSASNDEATASLEYLRTGVKSPKMEARRPYITGLRNKGEERRLQQALRAIEAQIIVLPDLSGMDDRAFAQAYTDLLLKLRARLLPDSDCA